MQIEKALINDCLGVPKISWKFPIPTICSSWPFLLFFLFINKTLRLNNLTIATAVNTKISVFAIRVEAAIYLLLYNLHDCTFNKRAKAPVFIIHLCVASII